MFKVETKCPICGNKKFFIYTENFYIAEINNGSLIGEKDSETITEIRCSNCDTQFTEDQFKEITL